MSKNNHTRIGGKVTAKVKAPLLSDSDSRYRLGTRLDSFDILCIVDGESFVIHSVSSDAAKRKAYLKHGYALNQYIDLNNENDVIYLDEL